jgi:hypothetical protein
MGQAAAVSALRAESKGLLRDIEGRHLLTGPVQGILEKVKTPTDLQKLIAAVADSEQRRVTAVAFGEPDPEPDPSKATRWTFGLALQRDSVSNPSLSQNLATLLLAAEMPLESDGYSAGFSLDVDFLQMGVSPAGQSFRGLTLDIYGKSRVLGDPTDWEVNVSAGFQYRTSYSDPATSSYQNLLGLAMAPEWRSTIGKARQAVVRTWGSVLLPLGNGLDIGNNALGAAVDFIFLGDGTKAHTFSFEFERVRVRPAPLVVSTEVRRVGLAYRYTF